MANRSGVPKRSGANSRRSANATEHPFDRTIEGMNAGTDLWTLMGQITLPPELDIPQGHGKVPWIVRAIWEEHVGWFRFESTTELYNVPPSAIWAELAVLAGGTPALVRAAQTHLSVGRPLHALNFVDIILTWSRRTQMHWKSRLGHSSSSLRRVVERTSARFVGWNPTSATLKTFSNHNDPGTAVSRRYRFEGTIGTVISDSEPWVARRAATPCTCAEHRHGRAR